MSIYATLWKLKFPLDGDDYPGCEWLTVSAQGVPAHIGSPSPGSGYEDSDPFASFLPPPVHSDKDGESRYMRAVVFVTERTPKGTDRSRQEYLNPLLVLTGEAYANMTFETLRARICNALSGRQSTGIGLDTGARAQVFPAHAGMNRRIWNYATN